MFTINVLFNSFESSTVSKDSSDCGNKEKSILELLACVHRLHTHVLKFTKFGEDEENSF